MSLVGTADVLLTSLAGGREHALAEQGGFFTARTPTPGTGIIGSADVVAFTETTPILVVYNGGSFNVFPHYLRMHTTVIGATASVAEFWTTTLDTGNRYTSGGTALTVSNNNMNDPDNSGVIATWGAITASAATTARRIVGHAASKFVTIETVHDTVTLNWGGVQGNRHSALINNAAALTHTTIQHGPCMIGPGQSLVLVRWAGAQTDGSTLEVELGFSAR